VTRRLKGSKKAGRVRLSWKCHPFTESATIGGLAIGDVSCMSEPAARKASVDLWGGLSSLLCDSGQISLFMCEDRQTGMRGTGISDAALSRLQTSAAEVARATGRRVSLLPDSPELKPAALVEAAAQMCDMSRLAVWAGPADQASAALRHRAHIVQSSATAVSSAAAAASPPRSMAAAAGTEEEARSIISVLKEGEPAGPGASGASPRSGHESRKSPRRRGLFSCASSPKKDPEGKAKASPKKNRPMGC
jgi:hypothetical protein